MVDNWLSPHFDKPLAKFCQNQRMNYVVNAKQRLNSKLIMRFALSVDNCLACCRAGGGQRSPGLVVYST